MTRFPMTGIPVTRPPRKYLAVSCKRSLVGSARSPSLGQLVDPDGHRCDQSPLRSSPRLPCGRGGAITARTFAASRGCVGRSTDRPSVLLRVRTIRLWYPPGERLLGSTEILESLIGKGKRLEGQQSKGGFTKMVLSLAAATVAPTVERLKTALDRTMTKHVLSWAQDAYPPQPSSPTSRRPTTNINRNKNGIKREGPQPQVLNRPPQGSFWVFRQCCSMPIPPKRPQG